MVFTNSWTIEQYGGIGEDFDSIMNYLEYFWNIERYGTSVGDDFDARMNYFKHIRWFS